ncbi:MAG: SapC family protein [Alphaproteobacteria bacterium]|nr:SapC family protein [Alphaproteobacteria bacterium]
MARKPKKEKAKDEPVEEPQAAGTAAEAEAPRFPLFYKAPRPIEAGRHSSIGMKDEIDVGFAANANAIPLNVVEFAIAARHYPVVFSNTEPFLPVAITGLRTGVNAFVDPEGKNWARGAYVPAYVRRYPFILMENAEQQQFILCVDEDSGFLEEGGARPLFDGDGKPTEVTNQAMEFCRAYHAQYEATQKFVSELNERGLLTDNSTEIRLADDRKIQMQGYKVIDREKFEALSDEVFLDWRRKNWLPIAYAHMVSLSNWPAVLQRAADKAAEGQDAG